MGQPYCPLGDSHQSPWFALCRPLTGGEGMDAFLSPRDTGEPAHGCSVNRVYYRTSSPGGGGGSPERELFLARADGSKRSFERRPFSFAKKEKPKRERGISRGAQVPMQPGKRLLAEAFAFASRPCSRPLVRPFVWRTRRRWLTFAYAKRRRRGLWFGRGCL